MRTWLIYFASIAAGVVLIRSNALVAAGPLLRIVLVGLAALWMARTILRILFAPFRPQSNQSTPQKKAPDSSPIIDLCPTCGEVLANAGRPHRCLTR